MEKARRLLVTLLFGLFPAVVPIEIADPSLVIALNEKLEPRARKSMAERLLPSLDHDRNDKLDPKLVADSTDRCGFKNTFL
jgi:hypothetical protein